MEIKLDCLGNQAEIATGDAVQCTSCGAFLNCFSELTPIEGTDDRTWTCEFCGTTNTLMIEDEEVPKVDQITYISARQEEEKKELNVSADNYIIFCIDISGSM
jgi:uncharacterized Zn finger protein